jgi:hypothetical protein
MLDPEKQKGPRLAQIVIRSTREYNKIVGEVCDLLQVNRPRLFRDALICYLLETIFYDSNGNEIPRDHINSLADRLLDEGLKNKTYNHYTNKSKSSNSFNS